MNVLIIEDEMHNAKRLMRLLKEGRSNITVTHTASVADSIAVLKGGQRPDLILSDIRLSDGLSFEIFSAVEVHAPVVFTTAFDEYAIQAFKFNGVDYLIKPVEAADLQAAIEKAISCTGRISTANYGTIKQLLALMEQGTPHYRIRFLLTTSAGYYVVPVTEVHYIYSDNRLTHLVLHDGTRAVVPQSMEELESQLNPDAFFRANRQFILSLDSVSTVYNFFNSRLKIKMNTFPDIEVLVSREKAPLLKAWLDK